MDDEGDRKMKFFGRRKYTILIDDAIGRELSLIQGQNPSMTYEEIITEILRNVFFGDKDWYLDDLMPKCQENGMTVVFDTKHLHATVEYRANDCKKFEYFCDEIMLLQKVFRDKRKKEGSDDE